MGNNSGKEPDKNSKNDEKPSKASSPKSVNSRSSPVSTSSKSPKSSSRFDKSAKPADLDSQFDWSKITSCIRTEANEGSQGVIFLNVKDHGAVVLKGSMQLASEVFATAVARKLHIPGPKMRVIPRKSPEGMSIYNKIMEMDPMLKSMIFVKHFLVMEYLTGMTLASIDPKDFESALNDSRTVILRQLGALAALDVLLNNPDRIPLVASNEGNAGNVMLSRETGYVISLDNSIVSLKPGPGLKRYVEKVGPILSSLHNKPAVAVEGTRKLRDMILNWTQHDIGNEGMLHFQEGVSQFMVLCSNLSVPDLLHTRHLLEALDPTMVGLDMISEDFLEVMLLLFQKIVNSEQVVYDDLIDQANKNIQHRRLFTANQKNQDNGEESEDSQLGEEKLMSPNSIAMIGEMIANTALGEREKQTLTQQVAGQGGKTIEITTTVGPAESGPEPVSSPSRTSEDEGAVVVPPSVAISISIGTPSSKMPRFHRQSSLTLLNQAVGSAADVMVYRECRAILSFHDAIAHVNSMVEYSTNLSTMKLEKSNSESNLSSNNQNPPIKFTDTLVIQNAPSSSSSSSSSSTASSLVPSSTVSTTTQGTQVSVKIEAPPEQAAAAAVAVVAAAAVQQQQQQEQVRDIPQRAIASNNPEYLSREVETLSKDAIEACNLAIVIETDRAIAGPDQLETALRNVIHYLTNLMSFTISVDVFKSVAFGGRKFARTVATLLTILQRHSVCYERLAAGRRAANKEMVSGVTEELAQFTAMISTLKQSLEGSRQLLRLACSGRVLESNSLLLLLSSSRFLENSVSSIVEVVNRVLFGSLRDQAEKKTKSKKGSLKPEQAKELSTQTQKLVVHNAQLASALRQMGPLVQHKTHANKCDLLTQDLVKSLKDLKTLALGGKKKAAIFQDEDQSTVLTQTIERVIDGLDWIKAVRVWGICEKDLNAEDPKQAFHASQRALVCQILGGVVTVLDWEQHQSEQQFVLDSDEAHPFQGGATKTAGLALLEKISQATDVKVEARQLLIEFSKVRDKLPLPEQQEQQQQQQQQQPVSPSQLKGQYHEQHLSWSSNNVTKEEVAYAGLTSIALLKTLVE